jgi:hypothetical protein
MLNVFFNQNIKFSFIKFLKLLSKNKKKFFEIIFYFFVLILIRIITMYPFFVLKINNYITNIFYDLIIMKRDSFKALYSNFILNILINFGFKINEEIKNKKIKFDSDYVQFNPRQG